MLYGIIQLNEKWNDCSRYQRAMTMKRSISRRSDLTVYGEVEMYKKNMLILEKSVGVLSYMRIE